MFKKYSTIDDLHKDIVAGVIEQYSISVNPKNAPKFYLGVIMGNGIPTEMQIKQELYNLGFDVFHCRVWKYTDEFEA